MHLTTDPRSEVVELLIRREAGFGGSRMTGESPQEPTRVHQHSMKTGVTPAPIPSREAGYLNASRADNCARLDGSGCRTGPAARYGELMP